jgi:hypothetical protein
MTPLPVDLKALLAPAPGAPNPRSYLSMTPKMPVAGRHHRDTTTTYQSQNLLHVLPWDSYQPQSTADTSYTRLEAIHNIQTI